MSKQYTVLHLEKSSATNMTSIGDHYLRNHTPKNADPEKAHLNEHHIKTGNSLTHDVNEYIQEKDIKVRKNSVKLIDVVLSGSHDRMKEIEADPKLFRKWVEENKKFVIKKFGEDNIKIFSVHRDERTPHIHVSVVPVIEKEKKWKNKHGEGVKNEKTLSARDYVGGADGYDKIRKMHDEYAKLMKDFGLSRGVEGSRAKHETIKSFYGRIENPINAELDVKIEKKWFGKDNVVKVKESALNEFILDSKAKDQKIMKLEEEKKNHDKIIKAYNERLQEKESEVKKARREGIREGIQMVNKILKPVGYKITDDFKVQKIKGLNQGLNI